MKQFIIDFCFLFITNIIFTRKTAINLPTYRRSSIPHNTNTQHKICPMPIQFPHPPSPNPPLKPHHIDYGASRLGSRGKSDVLRMFLRPR